MTFDFLNRIFRFHGKSKIELTKSEKEILLNLCSNNPSQILNASYKLIELKTYNLVSLLDEIEKKLPIRKDISLTDYKDRVRLHFKMHKHYSEGNKCNCPFFANSINFRPDAGLEKINLIYQGEGLIDEDNYIYEEIFKCNICEKVWATNRNDGWHVPIVEWRILQK